MYIYIRCVARGGGGARFKYLEGLFTEFTWGVQGTVSSLGIRFTLTVLLLLFIPVAAKVDFEVSRIDPIASLPLLVDHFGPIRDTIESNKILRTN